MQATFSVSKTPDPRSATASKYGAWLGFSSFSSSGTETTRGRSRLLYCMTSGIFSVASPCSERLSCMFIRLSTFASNRSIWESATKTMPSTPLRISFRLAL